MNRCFCCQTRSVTCSGVCDPATRPGDEQECSEGECSVWSAGPWGLCNTHCGDGIQQRKVSCIHAVTEAPMDNCNEKVKPAEERSCKQDCKKDKNRSRKNAHASNPKCQDVLSSQTCKKFSSYCGTRITFSKKCCRTCFKRFKLRRNIQV